MRCAAMLPLGLLIFLSSDGFSTSVLLADEVVTLAGNGSAEGGLQEGDALLVDVAGPFGVMIGPDGGLYICETLGHRISRVDLETGELTRVVGTGERGNSGDGGPAREAQVNEPYEVRFDKAGHLYFVDMLAHVVRRVDAETGMITTLAGTGEPGFSGDGGPAVEAALFRPHSIALDHQGRLFICDIGNHRIRVVDLETGIIETFSGTGERERTPDGAPIRGTPLNGPRALDFDGRHSLYLTLREGNAVYRLDLDTERLHHLGGTGEQGFTGDGGPAISARLAGPKGIAVDEAGNVYLADTESHTIRVIRPTGIIETLVGDGERGDGPDGSPSSCRLDRPHGVCVDSLGRVYIGDSNNHRVRRWSAQSSPAQFE